MIKSLQEKSYCLWAKWVLYAITLVNIAIIISMWGNMSIWVDEACSLSKISFSYIEIVKLLAKYDTHCPLYFWILKLVVSLVHLVAPFLNTIIIARAVSLLPLLLIMLLSYTKVKQNWGEMCAASFIMCISTMPQMQHFSVEIRMYSWAMFFVTLCFILACDCVKKPCIKSFVLLSMSAILACYTHLYCMLAVATIYAILFVYFLLHNKKYALWVLASGVASFLVYLPWFVIMIQKFFGIAKGDFWIARKFGRYKIRDIVNYIVYPFTYIYKGNSHLRKAITILVIFICSHKLIKHDFNKKQIAPLVIMLVAFFSFLLKKQGYLMLPVCFIFVCVWQYFFCDKVRIIRALCFTLWCEILFFWQIYEDVFTNMLIPFFLFYAIYFYNLYCNKEKIDRTRLFACVASLAIYYSIVFVSCAISMVTHPLYFDRYGASSLPLVWLSLTILLSTVKQKIYAYIFMIFMGFCATIAAIFMMAPEGTLLLTFVPIEKTDAKNHKEFMAFFDKLTSSDSLVTMQKDGNTVAGVFDYFGQGVALYEYDKQKDPNDHETLDYCIFKKTITVNNLSQVPQSVGKTYYIVFEEYKDEFLEDAKKANINVEYKRHYVYEWHELDLYEKLP